jgi:hypothetical protein
MLICLEYCVFNDASHNIVYIVLNGKMAVNWNGWEEPEVVYFEVLPKHLSGWTKGIIEHQYKYQGSCFVIRNWNLRNSKQQSYTVSRYV